MGTEGGALRSQIAQTLHLLHQPVGQDVAGELGQDVEEVGDELRPGVLCDLVQRVLLTHRDAVGAVRGHGLEGVNDSEDARGENDLFSLQSRRVPVPSNRSWC